ncbi:cupin domain-containing protein [Halomonas nitroreducens]|uniref:Cupin domain-containing protein n=1 Tax=Halomonas nitroreducens TaxID=447425 RepID=A0A3S0KMQ4_9GAMM|nr:cupin domain-containing protein [Halomonas nitroreducens]RTQ97285.1 cupin domain-containing protein [Halomonas nitroreducens]
MTVKVIDFGKDPGRVSHRRLADLPERVVEGDPHHESTLCFESPDGQMVAGTWTSTPGRWHAFTDRDEFCYILSGHVRLIDDDGGTRTFCSGDAFLIPDGFRGYWEVIETTTKHFVIRHQDTD